MIKYAHKVLETFPEVVKTTASSPVLDYIFQSRDETDQRLLSEQEAYHFHHSVAQLILLCMRVQLDLKTVVSFLTTCVKAPNDDDWGKMQRDMPKYDRDLSHACKG